MIRGFSQDKSEVLVNLYGYFVTQDLGHYVTASDLKRRAGLLLSSSYIALLLENLSGTGLVDADIGDDDENLYTLNEQGILEAEKIIVGRGKSLNDFALEYARQFDAGVIVETESPEIAAAREKLSELADHLRTDNDIGDITPEQRDVAIAEISELNETLRKPYVRTNYLWTKANEVLLWITEKGAGAAVGELAKDALRHIHSFISVFFN